MPASPLNRLPGWVPWVCVALSFAAGTAVKVACASGGLVGGELGVPGCYSDVVAIFQARGLAGDPVPYAEVVTEYPPLTALQWWVATRLSATAVGFLWVTAVVSGVATGVTAWLLGRLGAGGVVLWALSPAVLIGTLVNWDPVAVALMVGSIWAFRSGRSGWAGALAGLGGLAKLFPLVVVPLFAWSLVGSGRRREAWRLVGVAVAVVVAGLVVTVPWAGAGLWDFVGLNAERPADWDTVWFALGRVSGAALSGPALNVVAGLAVVSGWAVIAWLGRAVAPADRWRLALPLLIWFLLAGKVYSPQFSLWLVPLMVLVGVGVDPAHPIRRDRGLTAISVRLGTIVTLIVAFVVADGLVWLTRFPFLAGEEGFTPALPYGVFGLALALRGVALVGVLVVSLFLARDRAETDEGGG